MVMEYKKYLIVIFPDDNPYESLSIAITLRLFLHRKNMNSTIYTCIILDIYKYWDLCGSSHYRKKYINIG
jgi:hypothetical protein